MKRRPFVIRYFLIKVEEDSLVISHFIVLIQGPLRVTLLFTLFGIH